jgi:cytochrome c biogenesis protein CcdA
VTALIALAFGAGLLAPVNPCGFALLPAYLATVLQPSSGPVPVTVRLRRALSAAAMIITGFMVTVTGVGASLAAGLSTLITMVPWIAVLLGVVLTAAGALMLSGRRTGIPATALLRLPGVRAPDAAAASWLRLAGFGAGYAVASASCTLPVLMSVVSQALSAASMPGIAAVFAAYAAGSAVLLLALATAAALTGTAASRAARRISRHLPSISGALLAASGLYLAIYWARSLLGHSAAPGGDPLTRLSAAISAWTGSHQAIVAAIAAGTVLTAITAILLAARGTRPAQTAACCAPPSTATAAQTADGHPADPAAGLR